MPEQSDLAVRMRRLEDLNAIRELKARYFRGIDLKDWDLIRSVFADDVECDFRGAATDPATGFNPVPEATGSIILGIEDTVAAFEASGAHFRSVHHGHMPEIEILSDTTARAIWAMFDERPVWVFYFPNPTGDIVLHVATAAALALILVLRRQTRTSVPA